jgi:hypothetical protein
MNYNLHLIDCTGRHYVFDLNKQSLEIHINNDQIFLHAGDNNVQQKFLDIYKQVLINKNSMCVLAPNSCVMLHADQIVGAQLLPSD